MLRKPLIKKHYVANLILVAGLLLAACNSATPTAQPSPVAATATPAPTASLPPATPTAEAQRTLVVCLADEPQTLYPYGGSGRSMWSVLEAVYDGPFDSRDYALQPVILQKIPSLADGDASLAPVAAHAGDAVVDADGNLVALQAGTRVFPSGCVAGDCAIPWDGASELQMDQLTVTFKLLPDLKWSDGEALTADDSLFSYSLAVDPATPVSKYLTDRTFSYKTADAQTVTWTGVPGFFEQRYGAYFFMPLPRHAWGTRSAADLLVDETVTRAPLGWGPYTVAEWVAGDHITMRKNPNYFRAAEGLPAFDNLVYRFVGATGDANLAALMTGECDVVDQNSDFYAMFPGLLDRETAGKLKTYVGQGPEWEHIDFDIRPASYDDGYNPAAGDRVDFFGDVRTRQAFASCIDRQSIVDELLYRRSQIPLTFLPGGHPQVVTGLPEYPFDPAAGANLLEEVGWKDPDNDPRTPRVAQGVANVPDGSLFAISYLTTEATLRSQVADRVAAGLRGCGIQVDLKLSNPGDLFGAGPGGLVFGRQFDLVQFSWESSSRSNCQLYTSGQVPNAGNLWTGANITGYSNSIFDAACAAVGRTRVDDAAYAERSSVLQSQFSTDLPVIPLYSYLKIALSRPDLCGLSADVTARSLLWNIEAITINTTCP
jgi:peptide/nickel transport system substrate-binding protein